MKGIHIDYNDLVSGKDISHLIETAFGNGPDCLGICIIDNTPDYSEMRRQLLLTASKLASFPESFKSTWEHPQSSFSFGWSHGKELMNGIPDLSKGSFYNNPIFDSPPVSDEYKIKYPQYGCDNIWPSQLPKLESEFKQLGQLIVSVGLLLAKACDKHIQKTYPHLPNDLFYAAINQSTTHKARLLHYFPLSTESSKRDDSWCGMHIDHSLLTGLTSAMYVDELSVPLTELLQKQNGGLFIQDRSKTLHAIDIPKESIAFQLGEAAQIASKGLLVATPHFVKGVSKPGLARNTFAVFMQPNVDYLLDKELSFGEFSKQVGKRHYHEDELR